MKTSNAIWLFLQKIERKKYYSLPSPSQSLILLESGAEDNKEQANLIR